MRSGNCKLAIHKTVVNTVVVAYSFESIMAKRRMMLSVSPELEEALQQLADVSGAARASVAASLLEEALPHIRAITAALEAAKNKTGDPLQLLNQALFQAINEASQAALDLGHEKPKAKVRRSVK